MRTDPKQKTKKPGKPTLRFDLLDHSQHNGMTRLYGVIIPRPVPPDHPASDQDPNTKKEKNEP